MLKTVRVPEALTPLFELAQSHVERYFAEQKSEPERATIEISGQRYVLVRAGALSVEFYELVRRLYGREDEAQSVAHGLLFDLAHAMGLSDARTFAERMDVRDPIARLSAGPIHFAYAGWAFVDISAESAPSADSEYYLLYDHPYSFESDSWIAAGKSSEHPVCVMNSGYSSGWCEHAFGLPLVAAEILCRAKGDPSCRFIMAPPDRIEQRIRNYIERHPELADRIVNYKVGSFLSKRTDDQLLRVNLDLERRAELSRELNKRLI
jgi:predicted hydrocarbon binding protein